MKPVISIIMGSKSDWATMQKTAEVLDRFGVAYEKKVVSAHRTPDLMFRHAEEARSRGIKVIIAGAGGAAHLPGMVAAKTTLPVIGVPVKSRALSGVDSLYSIVQMPGGVPVATMAIGEAGATNAALFALRLLSVEDQAIACLLYTSSQYVDFDGKPSMDSKYNPNGSVNAIEGITSKNGQIIGKMGHSERYEDGLFQNIPGNKDQHLFASAVRYFTGK